MSIEPRAASGSVGRRDKVIALNLVGAVAPVSHPAGIETRGTSTMDSNLLFESVQARLSAIAVGALDEKHALTPCGTSVGPQAAIQDCVTDLGQLNGMLADERQQHRALENALLASDAALLRARADIFDFMDQAQFARQQASHDSLTGLANRGHFVACLDAALARRPQARVALAAFYLDLDGFKSINDLHGHDIGDQVLKIVATRLVHAVRAEDKVARLGGDEFACLLLNRPSDEQLQTLASKLLETVSAPMRIGKLEIRVRASIGIAMHPENGESSQALLRNADAAMYRAKRRKSGFAFLER